MTLLEAMACELPVIASNVRGNRKIVQAGVTGHLFDLNRPETLNSHIHHILTNKKTAMRYGRAGRRFVERYFSFDQMLNNYSQLYNEVYRQKNV